jgi:photosystem II stability/assembly factor-like uncharacterized protein
VLSMAAAADGRLWLVTGSGLVKRGTETWQPLPSGRSIVQPSVLACAGETMFVGNRLGQITYSRDGGETWYGSQLRQPAEGITCLVASPHFEGNGVVLAGTDGSGILRSTDGGRHWEMSSFGLHDFTILALATAPEWGRREVAFAGTAHGLYRSPNGGRAWKNVDIGDWVFQAVAVGGGLVLAGTEAQGLFRSTDGGRCWHPVDLVGATPAINALWIQSGAGARPICLAGTSDGRILRSEDGGEHWTCVANDQAAILCLTQAGERLYAGLLDEGLLVSDDGGQSWIRDRELACRAFNRLLAGGIGELLAWGPMEGVWRSAHGCGVWTKLDLPGGAQIVYTVAVSPAPERPCLLISTSENVLHSKDGGQSWRDVLRDSLYAITFSPDFARDGQVWAATVSGELLASSNGGLTWTVLPRPQPNDHLMGLDARSGTLAVAIGETSAEQITVWRLADRGQMWNPWLRQLTRQPATLLSTAQGGDQDLVFLDNSGWRSTLDGWERVLNTEDSILCVQQQPSWPAILVLTSNAVLYSVDGLEWVGFDEGLAGQSFVDLALPTFAEAEPWAYLLTIDGELWRRYLPIYKRT